MALVVVMGTAAIAAVMAAHVMLLSETVAREAAVSAERQSLRYLAESAADHAFWMYLVDRRLFPDRTLGAPASAERAARETEAWMQDGWAHQLPNQSSTVRLFSALHGISFAGAQPGQELRQQFEGDAQNPDDSERQQAVSAFLDIAADYVDPDDQTHLHGMERDGYAAEGWEALPRDAPMQFREEIYWLPGWDGVFDPKEAQIIPPLGIASPPTAKPPFFSSSAETIRRQGKFDAGELAQVLQARDQYQQQGVPLDQSLDAALLGRLRDRFSLAESAVVTIEVEATSAIGVVRRLSVTRLTELNRPDAFADSARQAWALWQRQLD
jgi:hypothetical protein